MEEKALQTATVLATIGIMAFTYFAMVWAVALDRIADALERANETKAAPEQEQGSG